MCPLRLHRGDSHFYLLSTLLYIYYINLTLFWQHQNFLHSKLIPIPKPDKNYRPIGVLPYLSNTFGRIFHDQISKYLYDNSLLTYTQSGFRPKHSCVTALVDVLEELWSKMDPNILSFLVSLLHLKASDTFDHDNFCHKLKIPLNFQHQQEY